VTALTNSSNVSLRGENDWAMGEKVCFRGERMALVRVLVVVDRERALGRRFCFEGAEEEEEEVDLDGLQEVRIVSMAICLE